MNQICLKKYAQLAVKMGVNLQPNQTLIVNSTIFTAEFTRMVVEAAYQAGAKEVIVNWKDDEISRLHYQYQDLETLCHVPSWVKEARVTPVKEGAALLSIVSPYPGILNGLDASRISQSSMALSQALKEVHEYTMGNKVQWCVIAASNLHWAKKVFPELDENSANEKLWDEILSAVHVDESNDPIAEWEKHNATLANRVNLLNEHNFKALHFKNSLGTDLTVGLVRNHAWAGGAEYTTKGILFNANMPTEEIFCMPEKTYVEGRVYSTKPLDYNGKLIDEFYLDFKDGKVVSFHAEKEEATLKELIEFDEGSCYIGEVALVPFHSPISNSNILFMNTLFDENASCHLALGAAYPTNLKGGADMSEEELVAAGANTSLTHVDFMFGNADMEVCGIKEDGSEVAVFKAGDFVI